MKVIMEDQQVSTTPLQAFEQSDELLQQAAALRKDAEDLQNRVNFMYQRADTLTSTAQGLQMIASQDRNVVQAAWDLSLQSRQEVLATYVSYPDNAARFNAMHTRVEDGMVNASDLDEFADTVDNFYDSKQAQRSATPETETPAISDVPPPIQNPLATQSTRDRDLKRKTYTDSEAYAIGDAYRKGTKRMKHTHDSYVGTLVNDDAAGSGLNVATKDNNDSEAATDAEESSDEMSQLADDEDSDEDQAEAEEVDSPDDNTHTTDDACGQYYSSSPGACESDASDSESSSSSDSSSVLSGVRLPMNTDEIWRAMKASDRKSRARGEGGDYKSTAVTSEKSMKPKKPLTSF